MGVFVRQHTQTACNGSCRGPVHYHFDGSHQNLESGWPSCFLSHYQGQNATREVFGNCCVCIFALWKYICDGGNALRLPTWTPLAARCQEVRWSAAASLR